MKNSDQSAFGYGFANETSHQESQGLTKREYFAGLAMQGVLASRQPYKARMTAEQVSIEAIGVADELLKQLEQ